MTQPKRTSDVLHSLVEHTDGDGDISVQEILRLLGDRAFGLAILVFSLPNSLPIPSPPGFSAITGIPILLIAVQIIMGRSVPWLPKKVRKYKFSRVKFAAFMRKACVPVRKIERVLHPRLPFMHSWVAERIVGVIFLLLAILLSMPIPFGNFLPGVAMSLIALGMLERDGVLMLVGMIGGVLAMLFIFTALDVLATVALQALLSVF